MHLDKQSIPQGLSHVEDVIRLCILSRRDRIESGKDVAKLNKIALQTVQRAYTTGIGLRSTEDFDDLLYQPGLINLERHLANWFPMNALQIRLFFKGMREHSER